ncbi:hypothetical protein G3576_18425 [Roseomonas stagni]|uniref:Uncharacterized protein n=1 Tax=Falsiroseomonas algicola TaxID=2716930 RepID=A0A6M1LNS5_9PROT|nr:hypothetical protein [Falsiroseomonas algicola]NGM22006.1 hypothetical protein [Falsiroseomonas algicola]
MLRILLLPYTLLTGVVGRYPWPTIAFCAVMTLALTLLGQPFYGVWFAMFGAVVLIWLDQSRRPKPAPIPGE